MAPQRPITTAERLVALETNVEHTHELIQDIHARLFGNGRPGEIEKLDHRVTRLEAYKWKLAGFLTACSTFGAAAGFAGGILVHWIKK